MNNKLLNQVISEYKNMISHISEITEIKERTERKLYYQAWTN